MILVADNYLYHHKRALGSLCSLSKKKLVDFMKKHSFEYIGLPLTTRGHVDLCQMEGHIIILMYNIGEIVSE